MRCYTAMQAAAAVTRVSSDSLGWIPRRRTTLESLAQLAEHLALTQ